MLYNVKIYVCSKIVQIFSIVKPRIVEHLKNDDVQNGTSYQLNCSAEGDPALQYTWTRNGNQNIPNANLTNRNKTLHLYPVKIDNEGTYKCVVSNIKGNASTAANITVFGKFLFFLQGEHGLNAVKCVKFK